MKMVDVTDLPCKSDCFLALVLTKNGSLVGECALQFGFSMIIRAMHSSGPKESWR